MPLSLSARLRSLWVDRKANVTVVFGLMLTPIMAMTGAAVDYSQASRVQAKLQKALDAATIAAGSKAAGKTTTQVVAEGQVFFRQQFTVNGVTTPTPTGTATANSLTMTATAVVPTAFTGMFGVPSISVSATAATTWNFTRLRVALALDNTGSMASDGKMDALRTATQNLLNRFQASTTSSADTYVSIIPFSKVVNVGTGNVNASWLDISSAQQCNRWYCWNAWDGSVMDRDEPYDTRNTAPTNNNTRFPATTSPANDPAPTQLIAPTNNWTALQATVAAMIPAGGTNQQIGLAWAWQSLTQGAPLHPPAEDPNYTYKKVIIILSDGLNTENRFYGNGYQHSPEVDARQRILCDNIKATGIEIYAIQVNTANDPTSTVLQYCASKPDNFVMMTNASQMDSALQDIGTKLTRLRLTN
ncbi:pilus assembly protein TadG [Phreatobacter aquaticus]|uniref:Pilus assembly protein TadG n=1 Tax=Phreatobacter aquaticus TaxID=2570229 RepID=A0A4D7QKQ1_9HYPH|nr:Tad domain-containing protein [Phreatobacter aquaticus]QCK88208.1 pilus assembly protein TadG [Phreatobacter aquaticus]